MIDNRDLKDIDFVYPIKTDIEVLPADKAEPLKLNWIIKEYIGTEIYKFGTENPIINKDDLKVGDEVDCWGCKAKVIGLSYAISESGDTEFMLSFDRDDRHCWVCDGIINMRGITKACKETVIK